MITVSPHLAPFLKITHLPPSLPGHSTQRGGGESNGGAPTQSAWQTKMMPPCALSLPVSSAAPRPLAAAAHTVSGNGSERASARAAATVPSVQPESTSTTSSSSGCVARRRS
jgi:hypothetical protein